MVLVFAAEIKEELWKMVKLRGLDLKELLYFVFDMGGFRAKPEHFARRT